MPDRTHCQNRVYPAGAAQARAISIAVCEHGTIFVRLHSDSGGVFAFAALDSEDAATLFGQAQSLSHEIVLGKPVSEQVGRA